MAFLTTLIYIITTIVGISLGYLFRLLNSIPHSLADSMIIWSLTAILVLIYTKLTTFFYFMVMFKTGWLLSELVGY